MKSIIKIMVIGFASLAVAALAQSPSPSASGSATPASNDESLPPMNNTAQPQSEFQIKTFSTAEQEPPRPLQLVFPPHKSTLTPGYVNFEWKTETQPGKNEFMKMEFFLERVEPKKKEFKLNPITGNKRSVYCGAGIYRWRVEATPYKLVPEREPAKAKGKSKAKTRAAKVKPKLKAVVNGQPMKSRWRTFKIVTFKSRELASQYQDAKVFDGSGIIQKSFDLVPQIDVEPTDSSEMPGPEKKEIPFQ